MIKHSLRIGNKVKVFGKIYTIKELGEFESAMEETHGVFVYSDVQGVELTGEVLEACGFRKHGAIWIHPTTMLIELWNRARLEGNLHLIAGRMQKDSFLAVSGRIEHLHQLMNLFHCATGTELTINLEKVKV